MFAPCMVKYLVVTVGAEHAGLWLCQLQAHQDGKNAA